MAALDTRVFSLPRSNFKIKATDFIRRQTKNFTIDTFTKKNKDTHSSICYECLDIFSTNDKFQFDIIAMGKLMGRGLDMYYDDLTFCSEKCCSEYFQDEYKSRKINNKGPYLAEELIRDLYESHGLSELEVLRMQEKGKHIVAETVIDFHHEHGVDNLEDQDDGF